MSLARYLDPETIQQVARLDLRARFIVEGFLAGLHRSPFHGLSVEFAEHRKYTQGDDLRQIDWNVFARTDRLFVRRYTAETHLDCYLLVDASASMGPVGYELSKGRAEKLNYAIHIAAALGYLVIRQQDAVGLGVLGKKRNTFLPPRSRQTDLARILATLARIQPSGETGLPGALNATLQRVSHRSLFVLLSDLLTDTDELMQAIHNLRFRGHDLIVMHILDAAEARLDYRSAVRLEDPESNAHVTVDADAVRPAYLKALAEWRQGLRDQFATVQADYVALDTSMPFDRALVEFLHQRGRRG